MKHQIKSILVLIITVPLITSYGLGIHHSFKKHGIVDGITGTFLFPWAIYRGFEYWWHDDFANVNWDKRLVYDMESCVYFINVTAENNVNKRALNDELEKFHERIKDYPTERKDYLKKGTRLFIQYNNSVMNDFLNFFKELKKNSHLNINKSTSNTTKKLETELLNYQLQDEIEKSRKSMEELYKYIQSNLPNDDIDIEFIEQIESSLKYSFEIQEANTKHIYKSIFDEEL